MMYFLDCEFNGFGGELISLALVAEDGRELYLARHIQSPVEWVAENVVPIIDVGDRPDFAPIEAWGKKIAEFIADDKVASFVADWPDDIRYLCQCLITGPGQRVRPLPNLVFQLVWVDAYPTTLPGAVQHNALWDARAIKHKLLPVSATPAASPA